MSLKDEKDCVLKLDIHEEKVTCTDIDEIENIIYKSGTEENKDSIDVKEEIIDIASVIELNIKEDTDFPLDNSYFTEEFTEENLENKGISFVGDENKDSIDVKEEIIDIASVIELNIKEDIDFPLDNSYFTEEFTEENLENKCISFVGDDSLLEAECYTSGIKNEGIYDCQICNRTFKKMGHFNRHTRIHTGEKPFACNNCSYSSSDSSTLRRHKSLIHGRQNKSENKACNLCDFKCVGINELKRHVTLHTGKKPHPCDLCDYSCMDKRDLKLHRMKHTGEKPFSCAYCDYSCCYFSSLKKHTFIHTGEKPISCELCDYKCARIGHLKSHLLKHLKFKTINCSLCEYKCADKYRLKNHMLVHRKSKLFNCSQCGYTTNYSNTFKKHLFIHL